MANTQHEQLQRLNDRFPSETHKMELFLRLYNEVAHLGGDFAEFGVYNGGGARQLASLTPERRVWAFDTYEGMPAEDYIPREDESDPPGKWRPKAQPSELFAGVPNIHPVKGRFIDTLPEVASDVRFLLCHIDCDWYNSHTQVFHFLAPRLTPGAYLVLDDPNLMGAKRAINEWLAEVGERATRPEEHVIRWRELAPQE